MGNIGEALALGGVTTPQNTFSTVLQGMQAGEIMRNRKAEKDAKADEILRKSFTVDPQGYIPAVYGEAIKETENVLRDARGLKEKYGRNYTSTPEFAQRKAQYDYKIANFKEVSDRYKTLEKARQEGKGIVDEEFLALGRGQDYNNFINYQNPVSGENAYNIQPSPSYKITDITKAVINENDWDLFDIEGEIKNFPQTKDYYKLYNINPEKLKAKVRAYVNNEPQILNGYLINNKKAVAERMNQMASVLIAKGEEPDPAMLRKAAAMELLQKDIETEGAKSIKIKVDADKATAKGSGEESRLSKFTFTPVAADSETEQTKTIQQQVSIPGITDIASANIKIKGAANSPFVSLNYDKTAADNSPLYLADGEHKGEQANPLGFQWDTKNKEWVMYARTVDKVEDPKTGTFSSKESLVKVPFSQKKNVARVASYLGISNVDDLIKLLDKQGESVSKGFKSGSGANTQSAPANQPAKKQIKRSDIATKAKAAGYSPKEYEQLLITNKVEIID